jgi:hypothetical protein
LCVFVGFSYLILQLTTFQTHSEQGLQGLSLNTVTVRDNMAAERIWGEVQRFRGPCVMEWIQVTLFLRPCHDLAGPVSSSWNDPTLRNVSYTVLFLRIFSGLCKGKHFLSVHPPSTPAPN